MKRTHPIRRARKAAGLTSTELGRRVGVSHAAVIRWELGETNPTPGNARRIMQALPELTFEAIYGGGQAA